MLPTRTPRVPTDALEPLSLTRAWQLSAPARPRIFRLIVGSAVLSLLVYALTVWGLEVLPKKPQPQSAADRSPLRRDSLEAAARPYAPCGESCRLCSASDGRSAGQIQDAPHPARAAIARYTLSAGDA